MPPGRATSSDIETEVEDKKSSDDHRHDNELADMHSLPAIAPGVRGEDRGVVIGLPAGVELGDQDVQELARQ